jgi:hypothetical protein
MHGNRVGFGAGEALKSYASNGDQSAIVNVELPVKHAPGNEKGELDDVTLRTPAKIAAHADDFGNRSVEAFHHRKQLGAGFLVALATPDLRGFAAFRDSRKLKLMQTFTEAGDIFASPILRPWLLVIGPPVHQGEHHCLHVSGVSAIQNFR